MTHGWPSREPQTTNNEQHTTHNKQRTVNNKQHTTNITQQTTHIKQQTTNNKHTQQEHPDFVGLAPVYSTHPKIIANLSPDDPYITPTSYRNRSKILP